MSVSSGFSAVKWAIDKVAEGLRAGELGRPLQTLGQRSLGEVSGPRRMASEVAQTEGWSVEGLEGASDEVLGVARIETEALRGSNGEVTDWVSPEELAIYDGAGLEPASVAGREALIRDDIDLDYAGPDGRSNLERMLEGKAPLDSQGRPYELHHVQQRDEGVLAELTVDEHKGGGNNEILHDYNGPSRIDRDAFAEDRAAHWMERGEELAAQREAGEIGNDNGNEIGNDDETESDSDGGEADHD